MIKNTTDENNRFKRINVKKIISLKDLFDKPISQIEFHINDVRKVDEISNLIKKDGNTSVTIKIHDGTKELVFKLKNRRLVDRKSLNFLKNQGISSTIH